MERCKLYYLFGLLQGVLAGYQMFPCHRAALYYWAIMSLIRGNAVVGLSACRCLGIECLRCLACTAVTCIVAGAATMMLCAHCLACGR